VAGALDDARSAIDTYRDEVATAVQVVAALAQDLDQAHAQLASSGPLGQSQDTNLRDGRDHMQTARQRLNTAGQQAEGSREPTRRLVARAFPA